jgi:hypothetical protein
MIDKIALTGILALTGLQIAAWAMGINGQVFAFCSGTIGIIFGYYFGSKHNGGIKNYEQWEKP